MTARFRVTTSSKRVAPRHRRLQIDDEARTVLFGMRTADAVGMRRDGAQRKSSLHEHNSIALLYLPGEHSKFRSRFLRREVAGMSARFASCGLATSILRWDGL